MSVAKDGRKKNRGYVPAWCSRGVSLAVNTVLLMQITYYATESVGLSAGLIGTLLLVSKLFDGVTDLVAGFLIDRTHTRWGKARPYELFIIPTWLLTVVLFSTPDMGKTAQAVYIFVLYVLINAVCVTCLSASEAVYLSRSTEDEVLRAKALSMNGILCMVIPAMVAIVLPIMLATWGTQPGGWRKISLVLGIPFLVIGLFRFLFIKEIEVEETATKQEQISFKESIGCLVQNKYIFILAGAMLLCQTATNIASSVQTYYFTYIIGNLAIMSVVGMLGLVAPFILILFPVALRKIGGMSFVKIGLIVAATGSVIKFFAGTNMPMLIVGGLFAGVGTTILMMIGSVFVIQCMDYGEWKTGKRVEGVLNCMAGFASKVGTGIASGLVGLIMGAAGYVGGAAQQTEAANMSIVLCYSLVPAVICVAMLILLHFYDLEKKTGEIQADLAERRKNTGEGLQ